MVKGWDILTESQPCLSDLQVNGKIDLEAQLLECDVRPWLPLQGGILHVAVEDTWRS